MVDALETACSFLVSLQRYDLSLLLDRCSVAINNVRESQFVDDEWFPNIRDEAVFVYAPSPIDEALEALPAEDRKRIAEAIANGYKKRRSYDDIRVESVPANAKGVAALLAELIVHRGMMISVATGGNRIQDVNDYYVAREARIRQGMPSDVQYENPHGDLWAWYHHWNAHFGRWAERRH